MDIIVVANGCADATAEVAASFGPAVRVLTLPVACKHEALAAGDRAAAGFPRIYVDADVELRLHDVRALAAALWPPGGLAAAPPPGPVHPPPPPPLLSHPHLPRTPPRC